MNEQIAWNFFFDGDASANTITYRPKTKEDDEKVLFDVKNQCLIHLKSDEYEIYINLDKVKCISRVIDKKESTSNDETNESD